MACQQLGKVKGTRDEHRTLRWNTEERSGDKQSQGRDHEHDNAPQCKTCHGGGLSARKSTQHQHYNNGSHEHDCRRDN
jgi:hypothetical protein